MGVVNVTPDSFSDGGAFLDPARAIAQGEALAAAGADILDIGGESTRPGAEDVPDADELARVLPVIEGLVRAGAPPISVDTRKAAVMEAALQVGARLINDVSALTFDARSPAVAAKSGAPVILMHAQGTPKTMQAAPSYGDVVSDVAAFLRARMDAAEAAGVMRGQLIVDPGIGFGKTLAHNLALMNGLAAFKALGAPILFGASRKSFIEKLDPGAAPMERIGGSLAAALTAARAGATILRVHDVAETRQALRVQQAIAAAGCATGDAREQH